MKEIDRYKKQYKLTDEDKADIAMSHLLDRSIKNTDALCDKYNITRKTIYNIVNDKKNKELVEKAISDKEEVFCKKCTILIDKALNRINREIENGESIDVGKLATVAGILYDKSRLEKGLSTENKAVSVNINID